MARTATTQETHGIQESMDPGGVIFLEHLSV